MKITLTRNESGPSGIFGKLDILNIVSGELPWRGNESDVSCIPTGIYEVVWGISEKWGACYHVQGVLNRQNIEIHPANFCGDIHLGYKSDLEGCICLGESIGMISGQYAIIDSRLALSRFENFLNRQPFELAILQLR